MQVVDEILDPLQALVKIAPNINGFLTDGTI
jgi:hypothetical protein